jgi:ABC-type phosphate/phosphonate transport system substrate-binding protein
MNRRIRMMRKFGSGLLGLFLVFAALNIAGCGGAPTQAVTAAQPQTLRVGTIPAEDATRMRRLISRWPHIWRRKSA